MLCESESLYMLYEFICMYIFAISNICKCIVQLFKNFKYYNLNLNYCLN